MLRTKKLTTKKREQVQTLLDKWGKEMEKKTPLTADGNINMVEFREMQEVRDIIRELKKHGIKSNAGLFDNGFVAAGMLLRF